MRLTKLLLFSVVAFSLLHSSVTEPLGGKPPKGLESNWIPTEGKRVAPALRFYGAKKEVIEKTFVMPDMEKVE